MAKPRRRFVPDWARAGKTITTGNGNQPGLFDQLAWAQPLGCGGPLQEMVFGGLKTLATGRKTYSSKIFRRRFSPRAM
jgi:hypothetical protein